MKQKKIEKQIKEFKDALSMARYRQAGMFPGPGIDEDIKKFEKEIKRLTSLLKNEIR